MTDLFQITPPVIRAEGKDVPPEQIQAGFNSLARQTQIGLNSVATDPTGPASGDLSGFYPAPTVAAVHATGGTLDGVAVGSTTPSTGAFTTLTATTPVAVTSGGTGSNALNAHNVLIGEGSSAVGFATPGTAGKMLISQGAAVDPAFANNPIITGGTVDGAPIGNTTPAAGNFTTLAASGAVSGTGFTNLFASPPPIGSTTANTGAFTTLTATTPVGVASGGTGRATLTAHGVLLGEGTAAINQTVVGTTGQMLLGATGADPAFGNNPTITGGTIDGAVIGGTTPASGSFTTLSSTGNFTPSQTNGIVGTTTNNNANAGSVGEFISSTVLVGSAVVLTSGTAANVTSISLTAGDWDVWGNIATNPAGTTTQSLTAAAISTVSATLPTIPNGGAYQQMPFAANTGNAVVLSTGAIRLSLSTTTTVFLLAQSIFAVSTNSAYGFIGARRRR